MTAVRGASGAGGAGGLAVAALLSCWALLAAGCGGPGPSPGVAVMDGDPPRAGDSSDPVTLRVLHTNDVHGRLLPREIDGRAVGGAAALAAHFDSATVRFDGPVVRVDGGDVMQGTPVSNLSWGRAVIEAFNAKGYDAVAVGNHEFDWGQDTLRARVDESRFPWVAANIYVEGADRHPDWARPWVMLEREGVRVGVVGLALATTPEIVMAGRTEGLDFRDEAEAVDRYVPEARRAGADFVVVTAHVGAVCQEPGEAPEEVSRDCQGRIVDVARAVTNPPDLIVAGHTHLRNNFEVEGIPVMQAERYTRAFGVVDLERSPDGEVRAVRRAIHRPWVDEVDPDTAVDRLVEAWAADLRPRMEREVVELARPLSNRDRAPVETALGNLLADAQRSATGAEVALVNVGSLRRSLPAGTVTWGDLFELQPFQNELVVVELDGATLRRALEHALGDDGRPRASLSGVRVRYDPGAKPGRRIREMILEDGRTVAEGDRLTLGTTEFVALGGDGFEMLARAPARGTGTLDVDGLVGYLEELPQPVEAPEPDRWEAVQEPPAAESATE